MHLYKVVFRLLMAFGFLTAGSMDSTAQESVTGTVSFITSENVYVRFENTEGITVGDSLVRQQNGTTIPCLVVVSKSSTSCVTKPIGGCKPAKGDKMTARVAVRKSRPKRTPDKDKETEKEKSEEVVQSTKSEEETEEKKAKPEINGRLSLANYTTRDDVGTKNRAMGRLAFNVDDIGPGFSFESYMNYTHLTNTRQESPDVSTSRFNVFNLALGYEKDSNYSVYVGRRINNHLASMGAVDGLQAEKQFGNFSVGLIGGFRPNVFNYGLDFNLPQLGGYVAFKQSHKVVQSRTSLGLIEQMNGGATDRRYAMLQHSSQIKKLSIFGSAQVDLYQKMNNTPQSDFRLTSVYVSLRYRLTNRLSVMGSFDNRRNLIFYESYASNLSFLTANNPSRQGIRLRASYRMGRYVSLGLGYNTRVQSDNANSFTNYNAYLRYSHLPVVGGSMFISYNSSQTRGLNYITASAHYNRWFLKGKLSLDAYYRLVNYQYNDADFTLPLQHYFGGGLNFRMTKKTTLSALFEHTQRETYSSDRLNLKLIQRF